MPRLRRHACDAAVEASIDGRLAFAMRRPQCISIAFSPTVVAFCNRSTENGLHRAGQTVLQGGLSYWRARLTRARGSDGEAVDGAARERGAQERAARWDACRRRTPLGQRTQLR